MFFLFTLDTFTTWATTVLVIVLSSIWIYRRYTFWSSLGIPGLRPIPLLGNILDYVLRPMYVVDMERQKKYGNIFGAYHGFNLVLNICSPELIKKTMISDFFPFHGREAPSDNQFRESLGARNGQAWKDQRSIMSQAFTAGKMKKMMSIMEECCESFSHYLDSLVLDRQTANINLYDLFGKLTLNLTAKIQFGIDVKGYLDESNPLVYNVSRFFNISKLKLLLFFIFFFFVQDRVGLSVLPTDAKDFLVATAEEILRQRRTTNSQREYTDMLQLLSEAEADKDDELSGFKKTSNRTLTEKEIVSNVMIFLAVGFESTGTVLSHLTYELAINPSIQEKLRDEIVEAVKGSPDGKLSYDVIMSLKYLDAVISEILRIYPPGASIQRETVCDHVLEIDSKSYRIPTRTILNIPTYTIHHNPAYFQNPETFDPERFMPDGKHEIIPYTYLPFGIGPRNCIANRFVLFQLKVCLAFLLQKYRFVRTEETDVPLDFSSSTIVLKAKRNVVGIQHL